MKEDDLHIHKFGTSVRKKPIAKLSGHVVQTNYKLPGDADPLPKADAMLVMPVTFNIINNSAQGIGDALVISLLCESRGRGSPPIIAFPCLKMDLVRHPAFSRRVALQRDCGIHVLHEPEHYPSPLMVPWNEILATLPKVSQSNEEG